MHKTLYNISRGGQVPPLAHALGARDQRCHTISEVGLDWYQLIVGYHSAASIRTTPNSHAWPSPNSPTRRVDRVLLRVGC